MIIRSHINKVSKQSDKRGAQAPQETILENVVIKEKASKKNKKRNFEVAENITFPDNGEISDGTPSESDMNE